MLNMVTMIHFVCCLCVCINTLDVLQFLCIFFILHRLPLRHHRVHELIYTQDRAFSVVGAFFFLMQLYSFFHSLSVNKGEMEGYVKLTAEEIAVKRSLHFSFSPTVFFFCIASVIGL